MMYIYIFYVTGTDCTVYLSRYVALNDTNTSTSVCHGVLLRNFTSNIQQVKRIIKKVSIAPSRFQLCERQVLATNESTWYEVKACVNVSSMILDAASTFGEVNTNGKISRIKNARLSACKWATTSVLLWIPNARHIGSSVPWQTAKGTRQTKNKLTGGWLSEFSSIFTGHNSLSIEYICSIYIYIYTRYGTYIE